MCKLNLWKTVTHNFLSTHSDPTKLKKKIIIIITIIKMAATGLFSLAGFNEILSPNNMTWCLMPDTRLRFFTLLHHSWSPCSRRFPTYIYLLYILNPSTHPPLPTSISTDRECSRRLIHFGRLIYPPRSAVTSVVTWTRFVRPDLTVLRPSLTHTFITLWHSRTRWRI